MSSIIIARLLGPLMLASAVAVVLNRKGIQKTVEGGAKNPAFTYLAGVITMLAGLAIVQFHNTWVAGWETLITVLGWLMLVGGAARMLLPDQMGKLGKQMAKGDGALLASAAISAVIGVYLIVRSF